MYAYVFCCIAFPVLDGIQCSKTTYGNTLHRFTVFWDGGQILSCKNIRIKSIITISPRVPLWNCV
ncbi:hypothetical protein, unlikely [Trypanosoma brucei brucei TREU927]|uniref:Uncharacterized protein n=1 Tax=Trypanosoma brucei brucei (strain 927/4 GUTat10.1) TaxID=185431 RepID=Q38CR6_TRYB2|nr:hypothetical protein, unlikely [Trypanosoma brucei brucei TREU927]EAN77404.1 hypothetical protein, unlikely [Trypanosoma brucei brucei TREU927]